MAEIISVRFRSEGKQYYFDPQGMTFHAGDGVIVETAGGIEYAKCIRGNFYLDESELAAPLRPVIRAATPEDLEVVERNREKEKYAFKVCQEKILEHELEMKLVSVECSFEGTKILFFFTSEGRVDFRALVKSLAAIFHTRIELRQIGIRDEAKMLGGLGICGRPFCCNSFLREFQPVSIKMAKTQNLSLNPTKISGTCGRLMCCLKYEQEAYEDLMKDAPRADSFVETPDGAGNIISVNTLRETVRVRLDNEPDTLKTYHNSEIRVVRSGKGKRPEDYVEPPLEELAKLRKVTVSPEEQYRREQAALAAALDEFMSEHTSRVAQEPATQEPPHGSSRRRRGGDRGKNAEKAEKALEADLEREKEKQEAKSRRNRGRGRKEGPKEGAPAEPIKEQAPAEGKKEGSRRRHRGSRGSHSAEKAQKQGQQQPQAQQPEKAKKPQQPPKAPPAEGKSEGGEKKGRPRWHKRGPRKPGSGSKPTGEG
ncbi:MAG: stage 0 sporulation family protein [Ruminiclostridium sp.]|nr:stage 0 sporulation family protein [Ruminiclostridium sp.]